MRCSAGHCQHGIFGFGLDLLLHRQLRHMQILLAKLPRAQLSNRLRMTSRSATDILEEGNSALRACSSEPKTIFQLYQELPPELRYQIDRETPYSFDVTPDTLSGLPHFHDYWSSHCPGRDVYINLRTPFPCVSSNALGSGLKVLGERKPRQHTKGIWTLVIGEEDACGDTIDEGKRVISQDPTAWIQLFDRLEMRFGSRRPTQLLSLSDNQAVLSSWLGTIPHLTIVYDSIHCGVWRHTDALSSRSAFAEQSCSSVRRKAGEKTKLQIATAL